jgi:hypothetical protein
MEVTNRYKIVTQKNSSKLCFWVNIFLILSFPLVGNPSGVMRIHNNTTKQRKIPGKPE